MFPEGRIFDFVIIGVLALIVVGPKDLPILMRKVGRFVAHMRSMAAEFRASFDEMARQSELDDLRKEVEALRSGQSLQTAVGLGPESGVHEVFNDIHAGMSHGEPVGTPVGASPGAASPEAPSPELVSSGVSASGPIQPLDSAVAAEGGEAAPVMTALPRATAAHEPSYAAEALVREAHAPESRTKEDGSQAVGAPL